MKATYSRAACVPLRALCPSTSPPPQDPVGCTSSAVGLKVKQRYDRTEQADLCNGRHLNRDMADAQAGLRHPATPNGYMVPQPMVAVYKAATAATAV